MDYGGGTFGPLPNYRISRRVNMVHSVFIARHTSTQSLTTTLRVMDICAQNARSLDKRLVVSTGVEQLNLNAPLL